MQAPELPPPQLDHVSLLCRRSDLEDRGFRVTATPGSEEHARVFLAGTYLEVVPPKDGSPDIVASAWFLRVEDPSRAADRLREAGLAVEGPTPYVGLDGTWLDVEMATGEGGGLPIVTRRTDLEQSDWVPQSIEPHPNGATRLASVRLRAEDARPLERLFDSLGVRPGRGGAVVLQGGAEVEIERDARRPDGIVGLVFDSLGAEPILLPVTPRPD